MRTELPGACGIAAPGQLREAPDAAHPLPRQGAARGVLEMYPGEVFNSEKPTLAAL